MEKNRIVVHFLLKEYYGILIFSKIWKLDS